MKSASKIATNCPRATFRPASRAPALNPRPVGAVEVLDVEPLRHEAVHRRRATSVGLVRRVVEHLDFEEILRVVDARRRLEQPVDDVHLVVERQLDGDRRQRAVPGRRRPRHPVLVLHVGVDQVVPVPPVHGPG